MEGVENERVSVKFRGSNAPGWRFIPAGKPDEYEERGGMLSRQAGDHLQ
jgi:hypothetical protein